MDSIDLFSIQISTDDTMFHIHRFDSFDLNMLNERNRDTICLLYK